MWWLGPDRYATTNIMSTDNPFKRLRGGTDDQQSEQLEALGDITSGLDERLHRLEVNAIDAHVLALGIKQAIKELAAEDSETLRHFMRAVFRHLSDDASRWIGSKVLAAIAGALFAAAMWIVTKKWG